MTSPTDEWEGTHATADAPSADHTSSHDLNTENAFGVSAGSMGSETSVSFMQTRSMRFVREVVETVVLTAIIFFAVRLAVQNFKVSGISMMPTVHSGDLVLINKLDYYFESPQRGDVIVFKAPPAPTDDYIKRVIGVPGDTVRIRQGKGVWVNGKKLSESYIPKSQIPNYTACPFGCDRPITVPKNDYFVLGDNRNESYDSHDWGFVPRQNIIGKALVSYWPISDLRFFSF